MANNHLKVIVEANVPYMEPLEKFVDVVRYESEDITREVVADADAIIVRTRTRCNRDLLEGSKVKFVGTATIGLDHIDQAWCASADIRAVNAPGCNAPAVAQYVFCSLARVVNRPLRAYTIGIVGVGHVGKIVEQWARALEMKVMRCDPPRQRAEGGNDWYSLAEVAEKADIITFHTPLTRMGEDATFHLAGEAFFAAVRRAPIIVNAARGPVVDTDAWIAALRSGRVGKAIVDCWEGEPDLSRELLELATIATPHIAGYSRQGKMRASQMVVDQLTDCFDMPKIDLFEEVLPAPARSITTATALRGYNPLDDTKILRQNPDKLEDLRNHYPLREELPETFSH